MGEEDRKKYAMAQASQRAAGGAYFTEPPVGHVYELSEAELHKAGWKEAVESPGGPHSASPPLGHNNSYKSVASGEGASPIGSPVPEASPTALALPPTASARTSQHRRTERSPLSRVSLVRTVSKEGPSFELDDQTQQSLDDSPILRSQTSHPSSRTGTAHSS